MTSEDPCQSCTVHNTENLQRLGVYTGRHDFVVALAGNPNTGKSTIFNALTGLRQRVGNWSGKTVARAEGTFRYAGKAFLAVDLPGTYSLLSSGTDEEIARDFLLFGRPDVTIVVLDATRLERNLNLALQILEITERVVVAVNLVDEAERHGITVDDRELARELGAPVVLMAARRGQGIAELLQVVGQIATGAIAARPHRTARRHDVERALQILEHQVGLVFPALPNRRWVALRLLEGDRDIERAVRDGTLGRITEEAG